MAALFACHGTAAKPKEPVTAKLGEPVELRQGEAARIASEALEIRFEAVASDSRCPRGVTCIWAGEASVRVEVRLGGGEATRYEVKSTKAATPVGDSGFSVRLRGLEPYPVSGRRVDARDYRASLEVIRGTDVPADAQ